MLSCVQCFCRNVIDFGEYVGTCRDIQRSFADGECLDNVFMQCFIDCVRDDATNHIPPLTAHQLILDAIVGVFTTFMSLLLTSYHLFKIHNTNNYYVGYIELRGAGTTQ